MIKNTIIFLSLLIAVAGPAQKNIDLAAVASFIVEFEDKKFDEPGTIDFNSIIVKDYRFDTTKLGYTNRNPKKIVFSSNSSEGFTSSLNKYYSKILNPGSEKNLVIFVRSFWLQQDIAQEDKKNKIEDINFDPAMPGKCYADLEIFSQSGNNYRALLKLKNEFGLSSFKRRKLDAIFFVAFDSMMRKIVAMNVDEVLSKKREFTLPEIITNYIKRFDLPVLTSTEIKRGVFMSFSDFKQNKTVYPDFKKKESKLTDEVYDDRGNLLTDFWGFCDGKSYYIKINHSFFKILRQNNTFDLMGAKKITRETTYYSYPTYSNPSYPTVTTPVSRPVLDLKPLQLDMETGEVY